MNDSISRPAVTNGYMTEVVVGLTFDNAALFRNPYEQHRSLWRMYANDSPASFLFREVSTTIGRGTTRKFIVVSARRPESVPGLEIRTREYAPKIAAGERLTFSLRIAVSSSMASVKEADGKGARGQKVDPIVAALHGVTGDTERQSLRKRWLFGGEGKEGGPKSPPLLLQNWLAPRFMRHGMVLSTDHTMVSSYEPSMIQGQKVGVLQPIRFSVAEINGQLEVAEPAAFAMALFQGIGRGKGMGCGLLLVRKLRGASNTGLDVAEPLNDDDELE